MTFCVVTCVNTDLIVWRRETTDWPIVRVDCLVLLKANSHGDITLCF